MNIKQLLDELIKRFGFESLEFDETNGLSLSFDDLVITLQIQNDELYFFSKIDDLPTTKVLEVYTFLLEANSFMRGTFGGTIGIDNAKELNMISFVNKVALKYADGDLVYNILEKQVQAIEAIRLELTAILTNTVDAGSEPSLNLDALSNGMMRI